MSDMITPTSLSFASGGRTVLTIRADGGVEIHDVSADKAYRDKARRAHPDAGGSNAAMAELNRARDEALRAN